MSISSLADSNLDRCVRGGPDNGLFPPDTKTGKLDQVKDFLTLAVSLNQIRFYCWHLAFSDPLCMMLQAALSMNVPTSLKRKMLAPLFWIFMHAMESLR